MTPTWLLAIGTGLILAGALARLAERVPRALRGAPGGAPAAAPSWFEEGLDALGLGAFWGGTWPVVRMVGIVVVATAAVRSPAALGIAATAALAVAVLHRCSPTRRSPRGELIGAVGTMAAALRSGASIRQAAIRAASAAGAVAAGLGAALGRADRGLPVARALEAWATTLPGDDGRLVVHALTLAATTGSSPADALGAVEATLREREQLAQEVRALSSQARASAAVMVAAPVLFAGAAVVTDRRVAHLLLATPLGWSCLGAGLLLDLCGGWWMRQAIAGVG